MWVYADKPGSILRLLYLEDLFLGFLGKFAQSQPSQLTLFLPADYYPGWYV